MRSSKKVWFATWRSPISPPCPAIPRASWPAALTRSAAYQKNETDLVIVVTPHIVRPLRPADPIHTPLANTLPGNDVDFFLMGQAEVTPALARLAVGAPNRPYVGHIIDLPKKGGVYVSARD